MKNALTYVLGYILFLNYRIIYAFFIHKRINTFTDFSKSRADDNSIPVILTIDIAVLSLYLFNWIWSLVILTIISVLNIVVFAIYDMLKKRKSE